MPLIGEPTYRVNVLRDEDGKVRARITAFATYADRTASTYVDDEDVPDALVSALERLVKKHGTKLELDVTQHAYQALVVANANGELAEDGRSTLAPDEMPEGSRGRASAMAAIGKGDVGPGGSVRTRVTKKEDTD